MSVHSTQRGALSSTTGVRTVTFTGTVAGGGTVTQSFTTDGGTVPDTFAFDTRFTDLTGLSWNQGPLTADNIVAAITVPEPTTLALLAAVPAAAARRRRPR